MVQICSPSFLEKENKGDNGLKWYTNVLYLLLHHTKEGEQAT